MDRSVAWTLQIDEPDSDEACESLILTAMPAAPSPLSSFISSLLSSLISSVPITLVFFPHRRALRRRPEMPPPQKQRKVAVVGSRSVGKSSLTVQYVDGHFVDSYYPTIENSFSKLIRYGTTDFAVEIIDTAGQDEYTILHNKHFIGIHGYMIVYSVASRPSFEMSRIIHDRILNHLGADAVPVMLVGNKSDLRPEQRQVQVADGRRLAAELGCGFVEASARYDDNVGNAFEGMIAEIEKGQEAGLPKEGNSRCAVM